MFAKNSKEENKILATAGEIIVNWLREKSEGARQKMIGDYHNNKTDFGNGVAEISVYEDLITDIRNKQNSLERRP